MLSTVTFPSGARSRGSSSLAPPICTMQNAKDVGTSSPFHREHSKAIAAAASSVSMSACRLASRQSDSTGVRPRETYHCLRFPRGSPFVLFFLFQEGLLRGSRLTPLFLLFAVLFRGCRAGRAVGSADARTIRPWARHWAAAAAVVDVIVEVESRPRVGVGSFGQDIHAVVVRIFTPW